MARRIIKSEIGGVEKPTSGPVALSGYITLGSSRNRKGNKTWRTLQPSDLQAGESLGEFSTDDSASPIDPPDTRLANDLYTGLLPGGPLPRPSPQPGPPRNSPFTLPKLQTNLIQREDAVVMDLTSEQQPSSPSVRSDDISPTDTRPHVVDTYLRVFGGQLPDIIRLHEQTGDFDGQVVFIGHPNRDVSAHQWISDSFQWVNIGLWSQTRRKIEGSLAFDRLPGTGFSHNSIEYFKTVAEHRETDIKEHGRPQSSPELDETGPALNETHKDDMSEVPVPNFAPPPLARTVTGQKLEDPFVTPINLSHPTPMTAFNFRGGSGGNVGSLDYGYEFPKRSGATNKEQYQVFIQRERERLEALRGQTNPQREAQAHLREVEFGEEAATGLTPPTSRMNAGRQNALISSEDIYSQLRGGNRLAEISHAASRADLTPEQRVAVPHVPMSNLNVRNSIPTGPTVANPYRGVSTLNAAAAPYRMPCKEQPSEQSDSSVTAFHFPAPTTDPALRHSDPDGARQEHTHPIANGFNKQAPTKQNWTGPFFADSMPTAHDPTAALSIDIANEEKLTNWYRDGQSVSRQQDYARSLVAAAAASKARSFGIIGEGSARKQNLSKFENTHLWARIYENLSEYAEESRAKAPRTDDSHVGGNSGYFTRAWKAPPMQSRDLGPDGNNSFYGGVPHTSPLQSRTANRPYQAYRGDNGPWGFASQQDNSFQFQRGSSWGPEGPLGNSFNRGF